MEILLEKSFDEAINDVTVVGCVNNIAKLLKKLDTESQNITLCVVDLYFFSIMIKSTMTAQPTHDSEEKVL